MLFRSADTLNGGAGADTLTGGGGNDVFSFNAGQADGDAITDFFGNGALAGDALRFIGYGTAALGATFTQVGASNDWQIHSGIASLTETIHLTNGASVHPSDVTFL